MRNVSISVRYTRVGLRWGGGGGAYTIQGLTHKTGTIPRTHDNGSLLDKGTVGMRPQEGAYTQFKGLYKLQSIFTLLTLLSENTAITNSRDGNYFRQNHDLRNGNLLGKDIGWMHMVVKAGIALGGLQNTGAYTESVALTSMAAFLAKAPTGWTWS